MNVRETTDNGVTIVEVSGRLDSSSAPDIVERLQTIVSAQPAVIIDLASLDPETVDMLTLVLVGSSATRRVAGTGWIYTPRGTGLI